MLFFNATILFGMCELVGEIFFRIARFAIFHSLTAL